MNGFLRSRGRSAVFTGFKDFTLIALALVLHVNSSRAQQTDFVTGPFPRCSSDDPRLDEKNCLLPNGRIYAGSFEIVVYGDSNKRSRYIPLTADQLQQAVIPSLLSGFDPDTALARGSLNWTSDHTFTATLVPRAQTGNSIETNGSVSRDCSAQASRNAGFNCRFTIQFNPPVRDISSVSALIPYRKGDQQGFHAQDVQVTWEAPFLKRQVLNLIEQPLKQKVVQSVTDYTAKILTEVTPSTPGPQGTASAQPGH